jgi:hypothetical protein
MRTYECYVTISNVQVGGEESPAMQVQIHGEDPSCPMSQFEEQCKQEPEDFMSRCI